MDEVEAEVRAIMEENSPKLDAEASELVHAICDDVQQLYDAPGLWSRINSTDMAELCGLQVKLETIFFMGLRWKNKEHDRNIQIDWDQVMPDLAYRIMKDPELDITKEQWTRVARNILEAFGEETSD
jgi:hypothetical protein